MIEVSLEVPEGIVSALPTDGEETAQDMEQAVLGWEDRIESVLREDPAALVDVIERFEERWRQYDAYIVELRSWGQSPIYAMAWRDLHESLIQQLLDHDAVADHIDRERNARIVENGIRRQD